MWETQSVFCTFNINGRGKCAGVVVKRNTMTVRIEIIEKVMRTVTSNCSYRRTGQQIMRHVVKDRVKFYPMGVVPVI